jgi:hypothetical protein
MLHLKRLRTIILLLLISSTLLVSCGKDDINPAVRGRITWTFKGASYTGDIDAEAEYRQETNGLSPVALISGLSSADGSLSIQLHPADGPGRFVAGGNIPGNFTYIYIGTNGRFYLAANTEDTVVFNITELSTSKVKGSFEGIFPGDNGEKIPANGSFDVNFSK